MLKIERSELTVRIFSFTPGLATISYEFSALTPVSMHQRDKAKAKHKLALTFNQ